MKTVTKTAFSNFRQNRSRNVLCGIAILLTTLLIFLVLNIGANMFTIQFAGVNAYYPTYHCMFRQVSQENADALKVHNDIEILGLRADFGQVTGAGEAASGRVSSADADNVDIMLMSVDQTGLALNKTELEQGSFPEEEKEIAVYRSMLDEFGLSADIGDEITLSFQLFEEGGLGYETHDTFRISGFLTNSDAAASSNTFVVLTSMNYMKKCIPADQREYRAMLRLTDAKGKTSDAIEEQARQIAAGFGINENNIVYNNEYLMANYVDPGLTAGIVVIILVIIFAGILTIYSIYYVSMIPKVREYGRLKALGASKRQIRQIVFREGLIAAAAALPVGLILGSVISRPVILSMFGLYGSDSNLDPSAKAFNSLCADLVQSGQVSLFHWWIYLLTIITVFVTVYLALVRPMRIASKISPVEAMRYQGEGRKEKSRKGYQNMNLFRLTLAGLSRNKKRTFLTIATLSVIGILFMTVATVISCADPKELAHEDIDSDCRISIDSWEGDKMNPQRSWSVIMKNNPMDEEFMQRLSSIPGVEDIRTSTYLAGALPDLDPDGSISGADVAGIDSSRARELERTILDGDFIWEDLLSGDQIVAKWSFAVFYPETEVGDPIRICFDTPDGPVEKTFTLVGICRYSEGFSGSLFVLPQEVMEQICPYNLTDTCDITVNPAHKDAAYAEIQELADFSELFILDTYEEFLDTWDGTMSFISFAGYAFLVILGAIGIMNLINTMINSIYTRRHELGMLQAIGLSEHQLLHMMQTEGLFYTVCTLILSLGIGSLAGYGAYQYASSTGMLNITVFHYPALQAVLLAVVVLAVQLMLTGAVTAGFRRLSLIDRIRYSE